ncbi:hypothetical protein ECDEC11A_5282 [Escherichia coli DEC11A]|nr:hypothetical protein ECDEC11A_5282 [Escherichia coli DEC11A]
MVRKNPDNHTAAGLGPDVHAVWFLFWNNRPGLIIVIHFISDKII